MITTKTLTIRQHRWTPELTLVDQFIKDHDANQFVGIDEVTVSPAVYDLFIEEARKRYSATGTVPKDVAPVLCGIRLIRGVQ